MKTPIVAFGVLTSLLISLYAVTVQAQVPKGLDGLQGRTYPVAFPGGQLFESQAQPFNRRHSTLPAAIVFPSTTQEVSEIVRVGFENGYKVVARSGGHSYAAHGLGTRDGALVVDLARFKNLIVDSSTNTAVIGPGNRLGEVVLGLNKYGRALPHGTCAYVGWGGHVTLGGYGFTSRLWGLSVDTIQEFEVVLANGSIATASRLQNRDLFWGLRGAAPYLGIVTSVKVRTFPEPKSGTIFSFNWQLSIDDATASLDTYQKFALTTDIPKELGMQAVLTRGGIHGNVSFGFSGGWYAPSEKLNDTLKPLIDAMPYPPRAMNFDVGDYLHSAENLAGGSLNTTAPGGRDTFYAKSLITPEREPMPRKAIRAFVATLATEGFSSELGWWFMQVDLFGGRNSVINQPSAFDTAFPHRKGLFALQLYGSTRDNIPPYPTSGLAFLDNSVDSILRNSPRHWGAGAYANYMDDRLEPHADLVYFGVNHDRLIRVKRTYDPTSVFEFPKGWSEQV